MGPARTVRSLAFIAFCLILITFELSCDREGEMRDPIRRLRTHAMHSMRDIMAIAHCSPRSFELCRPLKAARSPHFLASASLEGASTWQDRGENAAAHRRKIRRPCECYGTEPVARRAPNRASLCQIYNAHARFKRDDTPRTAAIAASATQDAAPAPDVA